MSQDSKERDLPVYASDDDTPDDDSSSAYESAEQPVRAIREDGPARAGSSFDPTPYLRQLRGRGGGDYLDVKFRLLWLRKEHPDAELITEMVEHDAQMAIFKATVTLQTGGKATGYGSETASDFPDFIEKAETKAIGRALNALGFGAQFGERGDEQAPAPRVERPAARAPQPQTSRPAPAPLPATPVAPPPAPVPLNRAAAAGRATRRDTPPPAAVEVIAPVPMPRPRTASAGEQEAATAAPGEPAAVEADLAEYSWSAFWPWARERGLSGPKEIESMIGRPVTGLSPAELRELIQAARPR